MKPNEIDFDNVEKTTVNISELRTRQPFCSVYGNNPYKRFWKRFKSFFSLKKGKTHNDRRINAIYKSIKKNGYNENFPITVIKENRKFTIIDGEGRFSGAKKAHVKKVPIEIINTDNFIGNRKELDKAIMNKLCSLMWERR